MIDYFSHIPIFLLAMLCIIFVGDVTELMFTMTHAIVERSTFVGQISQLEIEIKKHFNNE